MTTETYTLNGQTDFEFNHPVRVGTELTVEVVPGGVVSPASYEVIGAGPGATGVTVRYPTAPTDGTKTLKVTRQAELQRLSDFTGAAGINATGLEKEFNNLYRVLRDAVFQKTIKAPVKVATTSEVTLSGEQTINNVSVVEGDRVLVAGQTDGTENGIYSVSKAAWTRTADADNAEDLTNGSVVLDENLGEIWRFVFSGDFDPGTTSITVVSSSLASVAQTVGSVSALQTGSFPGVDRLWLSGYYGVGTPGGGALYYDSTDTTTADNGETVFVDVDGKRWKRPLAYGLAEVRNYTDLRGSNASNIPDNLVIYLHGRSSVGDGGEGHFRWDSSNLSNEVGNDEWTPGEGDGDTYIAPVSDKTGASGSWVRSNESIPATHPAQEAPAYLQTTSDIINGYPVQVLRFIPRTDHDAILDGTSTVDHLTEIQSALDEAGRVLLPRGQIQFNGTLRVKGDDKGFIGEGRNRTNLVHVGGGTTSAIVNSDNTITRAHPTFTGFRLDSDVDADGIPIVFAHSFQFGIWKDLWLVGPSSGTGKIIGLLLRASGTTESTYNRFEQVDLSRVHDGFIVRDGANSSWWENCRVQPNDRGGDGAGWGFDLIASSQWKLNNISIDRCSVEYPGNVSNGIQVQDNVRDVRGVGNRFESLAKAISLSSGSERASFPRRDQHFSSNSNDILVGGNRHKHSLLASGTIDGTSSGAPVLGNAFNVSTSGKPGTGKYTVDFYDPLPDSDAVVEVSVRGAIPRITSYELTKTRLTIHVNDNTGSVADAVVSFTVHDH